MTGENISIGKLYSDLLNEGYEPQERNGYELIYPRDIQILTDKNKYVRLVALSRHKTEKHLINIRIGSDECGNREITVTTDHVCMVYNKDHFLENTDAKNLHEGDFVKICDDDCESEYVGVIKCITDVGTTEDYVYDCEVDDESHTFYCNKTLVHNSQFVYIRDFTEEMRAKFNLSEKMVEWPDEYKLKLWNDMSDFVNNDVNKFVQNLFSKWCHTEHPEVLTYALEYIGDLGIYESKKHYAVRKVLAEGPEIVNKIKYSGIELKKASIPVKIKEYLGNIYKNTLTNDWKEADFKRYTDSIYPEFEKLSIDDISFWKGYGTEREAEGFLKMKKGVTAISASCTFYNQLLQELKIGDKYEAILLGDKVRFCYIKPTNKYGIKYIAYKDGQWPEEFSKIFEIDYTTMFDKLICSPLKNFLTACGWRITSPDQANLMNVDDL